MHYTMNLEHSPLNFTTGGGTARAETPPSGLSSHMTLGDPVSHLDLLPHSPGGMSSAHNSYLMNRKLDDPGPSLDDGSSRRPQPGPGLGPKSMEIQNSTINSLVDEDFLNHYKVHEITGGIIPTLSPPPMGHGGAGGYSPYNYPHPYDFYPSHGKSSNSLAIHTCIFNSAFCAFLI